MECPCVSILAARLLPDLARLIGEYAHTPQVPVAPGTSPEYRKDIKYKSPNGVYVHANLQLGECTDAYLDIDCSPPFMVMSYCCFSSKPPFGSCSLDGRYAYVKDERERFHSVLRILRRGIDGGSGIVGLRCLFSAASDLPDELPVEISEVCRLLYDDIVTWANHGE